MSPIMLHLPLAQILAGLQPWREPTPRQPFAQHKLGYRARPALSCARPSEKARVKVITGLFAPQAAP